MKHPTLLCVDDDSGIREFYVTFLGCYGYKVIVAKSPHSALALFQSNKIDAVLSDYDMPGMTGTELAATIKRLDPTVPVILMSGCELEIEDPAHAVDAVMTKGASLAKVIDRIDTLLAARQFAASAPLSRFVPLGSALAGLAVAAFVIPKVWKRPSSPAIRP